MNIFILPKEHRYEMSVKDKDYLEFKIFLMLNKMNGPTSKGG